MHEMLRHPAPRALNIIIKKRAIAAMARVTPMLHSTAVGVREYYIFVDYLTCSVLVKIYKNILLSLNTALINHMADVSNATAPGTLTA